MQAHGVCWCGIFLVMSTGCGLVLDVDPPSSMDASVVRTDAGRRDAGRRDAGRRDDAGRDDAGRDDAGRDDAGRDDAGRDDAGRDDAGRDACIALEELCNSRDDDCDGLVDEDFDLLNDPLRCGSCDTVCPSAGGRPSCDMGTCQLTCASGRAECDGNSTNGCETDLSQPDTCGSCGNVCPALCQLGSGGFSCVAGCTVGRVGCGGSCVDIASDTNNCGGCGTACFDDMHGAILCADGSCFVSDCDDMFGNCDGDASNGCETPLRTMTDCDACDDRCTSGERCTGSGCR